MSDPSYIQQSQLGAYLKAPMSQARAHHITKALERDGVKVFRPTSRLVLIEQASLDDYIARIQSGQIKPVPKWWRGLQMSARKRGETWPPPDTPDEDQSSPV